MDNLQLWRYSMQRWQPPPARPAIPENDPYEVPFPPFTDDLEAGQAPKTKPSSSFGFLGRGFRRLRETLRGATSDEREEAPVTLAEVLCETDTAQADGENQKRPKGFLSSFGFGWLRNKKKQTDIQEPEYYHDEQYDYDYYDGLQPEGPPYHAYHYHYVEEYDEYDDQEYEPGEDHQDADSEYDDYQDEEPQDDRPQQELHRHTTPELLAEILAPFRDPTKEYSPTSGAEVLKKQINTSFESLSQALDEEEAALVRIAEKSAEIAALASRVRFPPRSSSRRPPPDWPLTSNSKTSRNHTRYSARYQPFSLAALKHVHTADPPSWADSSAQRHSVAPSICSPSASPRSPRTVVHAPQTPQCWSPSQRYATSPPLPSALGLSPVSPLGQAALFGKIASRHSSVSSIHLTPPRSFTNLQKKLADLQESGTEPFQTVFQPKSPASPSLIPEPKFSLGNAPKRFHRSATATSSSEAGALSSPSTTKRPSSPQVSTGKQSLPWRSPTAEQHQSPESSSTEQNSQAPSSNTEQGPPPVPPKSIKRFRPRGLIAPQSPPKNPDRPIPTVEMDPTRLAPEPVSDDKKQQAIQDARDMYSHTLRVCEKLKIPVPPYDFLELIGKGGSGRVYKCRDRNTGDLVAIKTVDTDSVDYSSHTLERDNTIKDFQKEVATLLKLKDSRARNINIIHQALEIGTSLWIVSDYCTGGSVRTLMRALPPGQLGLEENYIITIARELLVALSGLHSMGVIHRDIKATNVYITETGALQLGDYGVVGVTDEENSKRKTILGTPHWMPREFFVEGTTEVLEGYGAEIDIWAFGCTIFEMAKGVPPNSRLGPNDLGKALLKAPRLEEGPYSQQLRDFVAFCLNSDPQQRPTADEVLEHPYVANTQKKYPTSALIKLIERYKFWEYGGGIRQSLWLPGGAAPVPAQTEAGFAEEEVENNDDWNFSTSDDFNTNFERRFSHMFAQATKDMDFNLPNPSLEGHPPWMTASRAPPPIDTTGSSRFEMLQADWAEESASRGEDSLARLYRLSASEYKLHHNMTEAERKMDKGDLPLRSSTQGTNAHESIIDLSTAGYDPSAPINFDFVDAPTLKARKSRAISVAEDEEEDDYEYSSADNDVDKRATMEWKFPTTSKRIPSPKRATMDWTFASARPAEPAEQEIGMELPPAGDGNPPPAFRPTLKHTQTMPLGEAGDYIHSTQSYRPATSPIRDSMASMIDLDVGIVDENSEISRPGTAISTTGSHFSDMTSGNPFDLEEDPNQNELDRNRFSYHKQWQSEGGQVDHRNSARKSIPMHTRGSSLSSTDNDHLDRRSNGLTYALPGARPSNGHGKNSSIIVPDTIDLDSWPNFDQPGVEIAPTSATSSDHDNENLRMPFRQPSIGPARRAARKKGVIAFPTVVGPSEAALAEDASVETLAAELDRMCGDLNASLQATKQAFAQYAGLDEQEGSEDGSGYE